MGVLRLLYKAPFKHDNRDVARGVIRSLLPPGFVALGRLQARWAAVGTRTNGEVVPELKIIRTGTGVLFQICKFDLLGHFETKMKTPLTKRSVRRRRDVWRGASSREEDKIARKGGSGWVLKRTLTEETNISRSMAGETARNRVIESQFNTEKRPDRERDGR